MAEPHVDLDREIPDRTPSEGLPQPLAGQIDFFAGRTATWLEAGRSVAAPLRACALVLRGSTADAIDVLEHVDPAALSPHELCMAAWSASRVRVPRLDGPLRAAIDALGSGFLTENGIPLCTVSMLEGLVAVATGELDDAARRFSEAAGEGDARAPIWGAIARLELARIELTRAQLAEAGDAAAAEARRNATAANTFFRSAGYDHLAQVTRTLLESCGVPDTLQRKPASRTASSRRVPSGDSPPGRMGEGVPDPPVAAPLVGVLRREPHQRPGGPGARCRPAWRAGFGVQPPVRTGDRMGLCAIAHLLANRDRAVPAVEIAAVLDHSDRSGNPPAPGTDPDPTGLLGELSRLRISGPADPDDLPDSLRSLLHDDRQRSRVSKLVSRTIAALRADHRGLADHLSTFVRTGYLCSYSAPSRVRWVL